MFKLHSSIDPNIFTNLIKILEDRPIPINKYRTKSGEGRSQCWGIVKQRNGRYAGSRQNFERPEIYKELLEISKLLPSDFSYTSIQLNQNYPSLPHKDKGNTGDSIIIGFGDYEKGELIIEETPVDIKNKTIIFDGSIYVHHTAPWTGSRYSIVYHTVDRTFITIPSYTISEQLDKTLCLTENMSGITRMFLRNGKQIYASDNNYVKVIHNKPRLRECIE